MGRIDTPKENIENLLCVCVKQMHFPKQPIDWVYLLDKFSKPSHSLLCNGLQFQERIEFLVMCSMSTSV